MDAVFACGHRHPGCTFACMSTQQTICTVPVEPSPGSAHRGASAAQPSAGRTPRPPSPEAARALLAAADALEATGGRPAPDTADTDLSRLLRGIAPAEAAVDRAALMAIGAARGRGWSWPRIGKAVGLSADGARDKFDRAAARHPDYTAPLPPTLGAHISRAGDLIAAIADPPGPYLANSAARLLGAVLLTATLEETPHLVGHWLTDPALAAVTAAAARHPRNDGAHKALADFAGVRPGTRADLLDILREAVRDSPWALAADTAAAAVDAPPAAAPGTADGPVHPLVELYERIHVLLPVLAPGPVARALRDLGQALHVGAPDLVDQAMATVAGLDAAERTRALSEDGERLWQQAHRAWDADSAPLPATVPPGNGVTPRSTPTRSEWDAVQNLLALAGHIRQVPPELEPGAAADALGALADAIDAGAPTLLEKPLAAVAALGDAERARILGTAGERLWERAWRNWGPLTPRPDLVAAAGLPTAAAEPLAQLCDRDVLPALVRSGVGHPLSEGLGALIDAYRTGNAAALGRAVRSLSAVNGPAVAQLIREPDTTRAWQVLHRIATTGAAEPPAGSEPEDGKGAELSGYSLALHRGGLTRAAATALATPVGHFATAAHLAARRQRDGVLRHALAAVDPALTSGDPRRMRTLLHALPHLDAYGLPEWGDLVLELQTHARHLEAPVNVPMLVADAGLPEDVARHLGGLIRAARVGLLAADAPGHAPVAAAPAFHALFDALDAAVTEELPEALDRVAALEEIDLPADAAGELTLAWELLTATWTRWRADNPGPAPGELGLDLGDLGEPGQDWRDAAARTLPSAPDLASAVGQLLAAAAPHLGNGDLGWAGTYKALHHLEQVIGAGNRATVGGALDAVVTLNPDRPPLTKFPQVAKALRALVHAYDHQ